MDSYMVSSILEVQLCTYLQVSLEEGFAGYKEHNVLALFGMIDIKIAVKIFIPSSKISFHFPCTSQNFLLWINILDLILICISLITVKQILFSFSILR